MSVSRVLGRSQVAALALVLATATTYGGFKVGRNTVGSPQVKNNSLTSADIKDGSLRRSDIASTAVPEVVTFMGDVPADGSSHQIAQFPGGLTMTVKCTTTPSIFVGFSFTSAANSLLYFTAHDLIDNVPASAITVRGLGGGGNLGGSNFSAYEGQVWMQFPQVRMKGDFSVGAPQPSGCHARMQMIVNRLAAPVPLPRPTSGGSTCVAVGVGATCRRTAS